MIISIQIGVIIFLLAILAIVYQDEHKKRKLARRAAKLDSFWSKCKEKRDRRQCSRLNIEIAVLYEVISNKAAQPLSSMSRDISMGGIKLVLNEKLFPGTFLGLQLNITKDHRPIFAQGEVVWIKEVPKEFNAGKEQRSFNAGIKFTKMGQKDEASLRSFIGQREKDT